MSRRPRVEAAAPLFDAAQDALPVWEQKMNAEQLAVIRHEAGPIACYAGAGSGKTRALVHRVARLVSHVGVPADRIFCVTFSRPGADEMAARVRQLGVAATVQTWHAFCGRVLREEGVPEGRWEVGDKVEPRAKNLVKQAGGYKHENWVGMDLTKVRNFIGICKANLFDADSPEALALAKKKFGSFAGQRAVRVFKKSQELIEEAQLLTFDDMLVFVARYFSRDDEMRARWAAKFDYVMQDEYQDTNQAQVRIATQLAREHGNYMVVGDPGQGIYSFRGADPAFLTNFPTDWSGAKIVTMAKNYRSGSKIVEVANAIIREGAHRLPEDMSAERGVDGEVRTLMADNLDDEASEFVDYCKAHVAAGKSLADVTVLFRLNAQSRALEEALLREKLPYVLIGGVNFYERKAVKDLLAYLRLAAGADKEGDAFKRCVNAPFRFLGVKFVERAMAIAEDYRRQGIAADWTSVVEAAGRQTGIQERQKPSIREWVGIVEHVREMIVDGVPGAEPRCSKCGRKDDESQGTCRDGSECEPVAQMVPADAATVLGYVVKATNYVAWLEKEEGEESIESSHAADVREMQRVAASFKSVGELLAFVDDQVKESALNKRKRGDRCVTMMSCHKSKGLEWPVVWLVGCNDAILPHAKGDPEEERRIMYVAATRARDTLVVSYVKEMALRTGLRGVERSPFLDVFPGVKSADDAELSELAGEEIVGGMTAAERKSVAEYEASGQAARDERTWAEADAEQAAERNPGSVQDPVREIEELQARDVENTYRNIERRLPAWLGDGKCHDCGAPLVTHGEDCAN